MYPKETKQRMKFLISYKLFITNQSIKSYFNNYNIYKIRIYKSVFSKNTIKLLIISCFPRMPLYIYLLLPENS